MFGHHGRRAIADASTSFEYAIFDPAKAGAGVVFSNDDRTVYCPSSSRALSNIGKLSGQWYVELASSGSHHFIGASIHSGPWNEAMGNDFGISVGMYSYQGRRCYSKSITFYYWGSAATHALILDADNRTVRLWHPTEGWKSAQSPLNGAGEIFVAVGGGVGYTRTFTLNAGQEPFSYPYGEPPQGVNHGLHKIL